MPKKTFVALLLVLALINLNPEIDFEGYDDGPVQTLDFPDQH